MSPKSKKQRGCVDFSRAASAFWLAQMMPRPAGNIRPFCEPLTHKSTPHSSMRKSILPSELTASTISSAGWSQASSAARTAAMSEVTPVAVSFCVASTALILCPLSRARISAYFSTGTPSPHSESTVSAWKPRRVTMSIHRWLNWPKREASTKSPGLKQLVSAASQPPVPVAGKMIGVPVVVLKTAFRSVSTLCVSSGNFVERWSSMDTTMARCTRSGTFVGPGTKRKLRPAMKVLLIIDAV